MPVKVRIPTPLRTLTKGTDMVQIDAANVGEVLDKLGLPNSKAWTNALFKVPGEGANRFVNIYVNDEDIRFLENLKTGIKDGDEVSIVPAIAGG